MRLRKVWLHPFSVDDLSKNISKVLNTTIKRNAPDANLQQRYNFIASDGGGAGVVLRACLCSERQFYILNHSKEHLLAEVGLVMIRIQAPKVERTPSGELKLDIELYNKNVNRGGL